MRWGEEWSDDTSSAAEPILGAWPERIRAHLAVVVVSAVVVLALAAVVLGWLVS